jgi:hemolysin III
VVTRDDHGPPPRTRPRLRGVSHGYACIVSALLAVPLVLAAPTERARVAAAVFAGTVTAMFGASTLYHRITWRPGPRRWMARADHAAIYLLIAGTYTPYGLLVLDGAWQVAVLAVVWSGAAVAIVLKFAWVAAPKWLSALVGVALGWVGVVAFPELARELGLAATALVVLGGVLYTGGAVVYALRRPDPRPAVFGYHEVFHALVIGAAACQYAAVAFFVIPSA